MIRHILLIISLIALGIYGISVMPSLSDKMQIAITISLISAILFALIFPKVDFDFKFIIIVLFGYILAGKKFAYLSPFEPVFIGEIVLAISLIMVLGRVLSKGLWGQLFDTSVHIILWFYLVYGAFRLYLDYPQYGIVALKDAATVYYALFFFIGYILFQNTRNIRIFERFLPLLFTLGLTALFFSALLPLLGINLRTALTFFHKDAYIGASLAGLFALYFYMLKNKSTLAFCVLCFFCLLILFTSSMAVIFALAGIVCALIVVGRQSSILIFGSCAIVFGSLIILLLVAFDTPLSERVIAEFNTLDLSEADTTSFRGSTSGWRLAWWSSIWNQTMTTNPLFGCGLGSDIGSEFAINYWGANSGHLGYSNLFSAARYPHNILFTIIGRLGLMGATIFVLYFMFIIYYLIKFMKIYCRGNIKNIQIRNIGVACFVIAGLANSLVQSTYEAPYAAIPHWIILAYMAVKVKNYRKFIN